MVANPRFTFDDSCEVYQLVRTYPLATLAYVAAGSQPAGPDLCPRVIVLPLFLDDNLQELRGHVSRRNPAVAEIANDQEVRLIFSGASHYVSPNWYPSKRINPSRVPTWNYEVVEIRAKLAWFDESEAIFAHLRELSVWHERENGENWSFDDAPVEAMTAMSKAIIGMRLSVLDVIGVSKLSQNRNAVDYEGVIEGLSKRDSPGAREVATRMRRRIG